METGGPEVRTQAALAKLAGVDREDDLEHMLNPAQRQESITGRTPSPTVAQVEKVAIAAGDARLAVAAAWRASEEVAAMIEPTAPQRGAGEPSSAAPDHVSIGRKYPLMHRGSRTAIWMWFFLLNPE